MSAGVLVNDRSAAVIHIFESLQAAEAGVWPVLRGTTVPLGIAVPSVLDPQWNVILYSENSFFSTHVELEKVAPFRYDRRMFPEKSATKRK